MCDKDCAAGNKARRKSGNDPMSKRNTKILAAAVAGTMRANEAFDGGWRKAPCQCPICMDLIKGEEHEAAIAIMKAWSNNFQMQVNRRADEQLAAQGFTFA